MLKISGASNVAMLQLFDPDFFRVPLLGKNTPEMQHRWDFSDPAFPPNLAILDRARVRDALPRVTGQSPVLFFPRKRHEKRLRKKICRVLCLFYEKRHENGSATNLAEFCAF